MKRIITAVVALMAMLLTAQAQTRSQVPLADPYILVDGVETSNINSLDP